MDNLIRQNAGLLEESLPKGLSISQDEKGKKVGGAGVLQ